MNTVEAKHVKRDAFTEALGTDYIAVDTNGRVLARAGSEEAARQAVPGAAAFFTGKDLGDDQTRRPPDAPNPMGANPPPGVPTTPEGLPISDALADDPTPEPKTRTHPLDDGTPFEGPQAIDPTSAVLQKIAVDAAKDPDSGETPIKDALDASHAKSTEAENAGRHAKTDELQKAQVDVLEEKVAEDPDRPAKKGSVDPLDHDQDGRKGGNVSAKSRQRKPAEK